MKTNRNLLAATIMAIGLAVGGTALAGQPDGMGPHPGGPGPMMDGHPGLGNLPEHLVKRLNMTEEQRGELDKLRESSRAKVESLRNTMRENAAAERQAIESGASEKELRKLARKSADAKVDLIVYGKDVEKKIQAILTDEQLAELEKIKAERKARWEERQKERKERREDKGSGTP